MLSTALATRPSAGALVSASARCGQCGAAFEADAWGQLELVERVVPQRVRELVTIWPDDTSIEVRLCVCGRPLARKAPPTAAR